jgi:WD40 repeat protein
MKRRLSIGELSGIIPRMKTKHWLPQLTILVGLLALIGGCYVLARLLPTSVPGLPPLSSLDLPPQTVDGITATVESYYADASRLVFTVRVEGKDEGYFLDSLSLTNAQNEELNTGYGLTSPDNDPSVFLIDFLPAYPLEEERLDGQLSFSVVAPNEGTSLAHFHFDLNLPFHPALTFDPKQVATAYGLEILLDRVVVTPAQTYAYLCYIKPTSADWMIGSDATLRVDSQVANVQSYALLFDSANGDGSKGGEPGWTPPVQNGRCVKVGFPIGDAHPESVTLTIPNLEQSMPEVIPADELAIAIKYLKDWEDIEMEWQLVDHGAYPEYKKLPAGMTEQEAYRQFIRALGYIYPGTWTFELQLKSNESPQPKFTTSTYGAATPIPYPVEEPPAATTQARIHSFDLSPDGKTIALATSHGVVLWDLDFKQVRILNDAENFFSVAWSPDGTKLAAGSIIMHFTESGAPHLIVWDTDKWKTVFELEGDEEVSIPFGALAWSPDSNLLATSLPDRGMVTLEVETGKTVSEQKDFLVPPYDISWSPDGSRLIATGDLGFGFRRWRVDTGEFVHLYDPRAGAAAFQLAWSPDGTRIASGHGYGTVCFWTVSTNQCDGLIYAHQNMVSSLVWSPDGNRLATGGGVIRIWDTHTGKLLTAFGLNDKSIYTHLEWLDPKTLVSLETGYAGEALTIVRFWDVATGSVLFEFQGESSSFGE